MYYTEYQGNKWYNFFVKKTLSSTVSYPGSIDNFDIVNRYTEPYEAGYIGGYRYDYSWQDSKPSSNTGYEWISWSSRTVYRYRSRTITWNEEAYPSIEYVSNNYSLTDMQGNPLSKGIKWTLNHQISGNSNEDVSLTQYYVTASEIKDLIGNDLEYYEDAATGVDWPGWVVGLSGTALGYMIKNNIALDAIGGIGLIIALAQGHDQIIQEVRNKQINSLQEVIEAAEDLNVTLVMEYYTVKYLTQNETGDLEYKYIRTLNAGHSSSSYVSLQYTTNTGSNFGNIYNDPNLFGLVTYVQSGQVISDTLTDYLELKYGILMLLPWN